ncbi:MAG TPA: metal ABC transporter substrate-binding protein [Candidatus Eisenbacteria bacterium]|nr:metal ABC transporter substrate-binding protein [Candidatus Eisenbacteria bacterium]
MRAYLERCGKILCVVGCLLGGPAVLEAQPIRIVTTVPDLADMAQQIGKPLVQVESLTTGVEFMHAVPVKPSFVPKLNRADLLVVMGLDLESAWLPALLEVASNPKILPGQAAYVDCSVGISVVEVPRGLDRGEGDVHPKGNPHYNLDPLNGKIMARNIADGLSRNFPQHRAAFEANLKTYLAELDRAIARWLAVAEPLKGLKFVSYHNDWTYFANRFGLRQVGTIEVKPGIEPTATHLVQLVEKVRQEKVPVIIYGPQSDRYPRQLANQTGATVLRLQQIAGGSAETKTYVGFIDHNIKALLAAAKKGPLP